jgi:hypothetical protein
MATPMQSRSVDTSRLIRKVPRAIATPRTEQPQLPAQLPAHLTQSTVMISSLPAISTIVDGTTRQFYGGRGLPTRRGFLP